MRHIPALFIFSMLLIAFGLPLKSAEPGGIPISPTLKLENLGFPRNAEVLKNWLVERANPSYNLKKINWAVANLSSADAKTSSESKMFLLSQGDFSKPLLIEKSAAENDPENPFAKMISLIQSNSEKIDVLVITALAEISPLESLKEILAFADSPPGKKIQNPIRQVLTNACISNTRARNFLISLMEKPDSKAGSLILEIVSSIHQKIDPSFLLKTAQSAKSDQKMIAIRLLLKQSSGAGLETALGYLEKATPEESNKLWDMLDSALGRIYDKSLNENTAPEQKLPLWKKWWANLDSNKLLESITTKIPNDSDSEKIKQWISKLGDDDFSLREDAFGHLKTMGPQAIPLLKMNLESNDLEIRNRARLLLDLLETEKVQPVNPSTLRALCFKNHPLALETALAYLPLAENEETFQELLTVLAEAHFPTAGLTNRLIPLLNDPSPRKRLAAGILILETGKDSSEKARNLLQDSDSWIKNRFALHLAKTGDKAAVTELIRSIGSLESQNCYESEEFLQNISKMTPPANFISAKTPRKELESFWNNWWNTNQNQVSLIIPEEDTSQSIGNILVASVANNKVFEMDRDGKILWSISGLAGPMDAQTLPGGKVLIAEHHSQKVTERNLQGEILWTKSVGANPLSARRLSNGVTTITCRSMILELDRNGNELLKIPRPLSDIMTAEKLKDGTYLIATNQMTLVRVDKTGKETNIVRLPLGVASHANEISPNRSILMPLTWQNKIQELDSSGKMILDIPANQPVAAVKLPNRNILVATQTVPPKLIELDRTGKQVSEKQATHPIFRIRNR